MKKLSRNSGLVSPDVSSGVPPFYSTNAAPDIYTTSDFQFQHRRTNSQHSESVPPLMPRAASWTEPFENSSIDYFLPSDILDEIAVPSHHQSDSQQPKALSQFETVLQENATDAINMILELVNLQSDSKEKGKILRTAAEIAKRASEISISLDLYQKACLADPSTPASWIDRAKILDELGDYAQAENVLQEGVHRASHSEQLIRKLLSSFARNNNYDSARSFLGYILSNPKLDKEFALIEGSLFELRQGHTQQAMVILNAIHGENGWKPSIYSELVQYFERSGMIDKVSWIVEEGAKLNPRNAVICQALLRNQKDPNDAIQILRENSSKWTTEFTDKMTTIVCDYLAGNGHLKMMRSLLSEALVLSSPKQRYKLLFTAATIELVHGDTSVAPLILDIALKLTPYKSRPATMILMAKVFELNGDYLRTMAFFERCIEDFSAEWRVFLELAQFHVHRNNIPEAINVLTNALEQHPGSGRLWAFRVQLEAFNGLEEQIKVLKLAIQSVPKSGEVWCEAARITLNPLTPYFNLEAAKKYLEFAYRFTPQHGDTLVEMIRVELLENGPCADMNKIKQRFIYSEGNYGLLFIFIRHLDERPLSEVFEDAVVEVRDDIVLHHKLYQRAIERSSFVIRSINEEEDRFRHSLKGKSPSIFAFGLSKVAKLMLNPSLCETQEQLLSIILGTSACAQ